MKKLLILLSLFTIFSFTLAAEESANKNLSVEKDESKWSSLSYVNVPVLKVLEGREGYVVLYQKNRTGVGSVVIPKKWAKGTPEAPRKLKFRNSKMNSTSFMTVVKKDGDFLRVILTIPMNKQSGLWGLVDYHKELEGTDKDTLEELEL